MFRRLALSPFLIIWIGCSSEQSSPDSVRGTAPQNLLPDDPKSAPVEPDRPAELEQASATDIMPPTEKPPVDAPVVVLLNTSIDQSTLAQSATIINEPLGIEAEQPSPSAPEQTIVESENAKDFEVYEASIVIEKQALVESDAIDAAAEDSNDVPLESRPLVASDTQTEASEPSVVSESDVALVENHGLKDSDESEDPEKKSGEKSKARKERTRSPFMTFVRQLSACESTNNREAISDVKLKDKDDDGQIDVIRFRRAQSKELEEVNAIKIIPSLCVVEVKNRENEKSKKKSYAIMIEIEAKTAKNKR